MTKKINWDLPIELKGSSNGTVAENFSKIEVDSWDEFDNVVEVLFFHKDKEDYSDTICFDYKTGLPLSNLYDKNTFELVNS